MSCRVIGREVEAAFLGALLVKLRERGVKTVSASYIPTEKNVIVVDFYAQQGLTKSRSIGDETIYEWDADSSPLPVSTYVETLWHS